MEHAILRKKNCSCKHYQKNVYLCSTISLTMKFNQN
ncbi:MAG: SWIM zinc finger family protein [Prevotella sp.]|nr:SWIM zinc finger family protein [Prevotella sp.]